MKRIWDWFVKHKTPFIGIGAAIVLFAVIAVIMDQFIMPMYTHHGAEKELPDVTEIQFREAKKVLNDNGFQIIIEGGQYTATYPESTVVYQDPEPFTKVKGGRRIYVTLSLGEKKVIMPRVIGDSEREAGFRLKQSGLQLGEVFYEYNDYYPSGVVSNQSVAPDEELTENTPVDITVSNGRLPTQFIVPDVVGKSLAAATKSLRQAGLRLGRVEYEVKKNLIPDTVIQQSIAGGEIVNQGQAIHLIVSKLEEGFWE